ncbi:hypothetical protein CDL15_Pgr016602 [Punica granatum]|uniref:NB-ARC domain-containing protein n=1 Tax=Punica granatum TaxID=22663 RepID=A0A218XTT2_PUNGR|nr:hypothetical protein CDL15_Pgr016602 [Punica granatum]
MGGETRVTPWLEDLADLAHDVENLLDEFATEEVLRSSFMYFDEAGASSSKLRNLLIPSCRFFFEPQKAHIRPGAIAPPANMLAPPLNGRVGKATLAQSAYYNEQVKGSFLVRAWACVSDEFDTLAVTRTILQDNFDDHPHLKSAGEKIVECCASLPLAAKTFGDLLRSNYELSEWTAIAESMIWDLPKTKGIPQALHLSYIYFPSDLKRCFVYCAVFPKDYEFDKEDLSHSGWPRTFRGGRIQRGACKILA